MGELLDVSKGLHQDYAPISQPAGTYTYLLNAIRILSGAIENEKGTEEITILGKKIVGSCIIDQDLILFLYPSEIGVLDVSDTYKAITKHKDLNFKADKSIDVTGKKTNAGRNVYFVDDLNPNRTINLDDKVLLASPTFADDIKLQVTPRIPETKLDSVIDGGSLPTGVYQATARLLTQSTNAAPFGSISPLVSIVDDAEGTSFNDLDGASPQTPSPKAIRFVVDNIDPGYSFIEIAIITYIGTANISSSYIVGRLPIDGRTSISFTYSSTDQHKEAIDLGAIAIKPVVYNTAKSIEQKDNILVLSNLTAKEESFDFQPAVNAIKLKYFIEEVAWQPGYKDVMLSALKRSYQRGEVYSFAATPKFKTSYNTTAFHIAAPTNPTLTPTTATPSTRDLGTYYSTELYPAKKGYPDTSSNRVRHFIMPTIQQEPTIVKRNGQIFLRILGIEADFTEAIKLIPENVQRNLTGFDIVRQVRTDNNRSILGQGIAQGHAQVSYTSIFTSGGQGKSDAFLVPHSGANTGGMQFMKNTTYLGNQIAFFSPESTIYQKPFTGATKIEAVMMLNGTQTIIADKREIPDNNAQDGRYAHTFLDYDDLVPYVGVTKSQNIESNTIQYIQAGSASGTPDESKITPVGNTASVLSFYRNNGYLYMKLGGDLPINDTSYGSGYLEFRYDDKPGTTDDIFLNGNKITDSQRTAHTRRYLFNIVRTLPNQYGQVYEATYIYCGSWDITKPPVVKIFGGDTFITKFGVVSMTSTPVQRGFSNIEFKTLNYFFVESSINTDLRHFQVARGTEGQEGFVAGTTPYYPKYQPIWEGDDKKKPGILNLNATLGHGRGYNRQYSFENSIITYAPKQLAEETVTAFENRSAYSEQAVEGEQMDAFRIFLPNNYHDIPRDKGSIVNTFVHQNKFYHHTTGALYQSFFNEKVTQASNLGQVYLGTGGVFDRPSEPVQTIDGGYAGTQGVWGISTPFGYFFVDARQKKIFLLTNSLQDLSGQGMDSFFEDMEESDAFELVYDYQHDRMIISSSKGWTLSYQTELKSWTSFHSYNPYFMVNRGRTLYMAHEDTLYKANVGNYGEYFGMYYPMVLEYIINTEAKTTKKFDNVIVHSSTYDDKKLHKIYETFTNLRVYNELKDTSDIKLIVPASFQEKWDTVLGLDEGFVEAVNHEFRIAIGKDLLEDPLVPEVYVTSADFRPRMTGKWAKYRWTFNRPDRNFVLHTIDTSIRGVAR